MSNILSSIGYFPDPTKGKPVSLGYIYVGEPDTDPEVVINQKQVTAVQEDGTEVAITQPIRTSAGGVPVYNGSPVSLYVKGDYSLKILDSGESQVYYIYNNKFAGEGVELRTFDTVADMVLGYLVVGDTYDTLGYYSAGDGGAGRYLVVSGDTSDGYIDHLVNSSTDTAVLQAKETISLLQGGAYRDGLTETSTRANAVTSYANSSTTCKIVTSPAGVYLMSSPLLVYSNISLVGDGRFVSLFKIDDGADVSAIETHNLAAMKAVVAPGAWLTSVGVPYGFTIEGIGIDGNKANNTQGSGMDLYGKGYTLKDILIFDCYDYGIHSTCGNVGGQTDETDMPECSIGPVWIKGCLDHGIFFEGPHDGNINEASIATCKNVGVTAIGLYMYSDYSKTNGAGNVGDVHTYDCDIGFQSNVFNLNIFGGIIGESCRKQGVVIAGGDVGINRISAYLNNKDDGGVPAVEISGDDVTISNLSSRSGSFDSTPLLITGDSVNVNGAVLDGEGVATFGFETASNHTTVNGAVKDCDTGMSLGYSGVTARYGIYNLSMLDISVSLIKISVAERWNAITITGTSSLSTPVAIDPAGLQTDVHDDTLFNLSYLTATTNIYSKKTVISAETVDLTSTAVQTINYAHDFYRKPEQKEVGSFLSTTQIDYGMDYLRYDVGASDATNLVFKCKLGTAAALGTGFVSANVDLS